MNNYQRYLQADFGCTFAEYLGIDVPRYEHRAWERPPMWRMASDRATGRWGPTKKEAKASYKAKLK